MTLHRTIGILAGMGISAALALAQVTLNGAFTTTAASDSSCNPGPKNVNFLTTDAKAWLYVSTSNGAAGDVLEADYIRPDGTFYNALAYNPLPSPGTWCFDGSLAIAGTSAANSPGTWTIRGYWNSVALFTIHFTIAAPGSGGGGGSGAATVYYRFENGAANATTSGAGSILDSSGAGQNGTPSGGLTYSADVPSATVPLTGAANTLSLNFPSTGVVQFPGAFPLNSSTNATIEYWIKPSSNSSEMDFLWTRSDSSDANRFNSGVVTGASGRSVFLDYREVNGTLHSLPNVPIASSGWTHVAVVKTGNVWTGYANGVQQGTPVTDSSPNLPTNTGWTFNGRNTQDYTGLLDEFRISNTALTPAQFLYPASGGGGGGGGGGTAGANLIQNPGADMGTGDPNCAAATSVPGWSITGHGMAICAYGSSAGVSATDPGPSDRGANFFSGGPSNAASSLTQRIDVSGMASNIDTGSFGYTLSGWLGGWSSQDDNAVLSVTFLSASSASLGTAQIGPVLAADRNSVTGMLQKTTTGTVPAGTRVVTVVLQFTRVSGDYDDGVADSLSLIFGSSGGGGGGGGGGGETCNFFVNPLNNSIGASGGTGLVLITTATGCAWSATSNAPAWITISAGASGTGSGAVSYTVAANTSTSSRTGTITIAGQTHTVTQAGAPACSYTLGGGSTNLAAAGGSGAVLLTTGSSCAWSVTSSVSWIHLTVPSGTGSASVNFTVDANTTASSRTGTLTIAGQSFTVNQAAAPSGSLPTISSGGVVNAASYTPATLSAGAIAQGSFFSIFGANLGPAQYQSQTAYPLQTALGGVGVTITQGGTSVSAYLVFVSSTQINAIMPSNAPVGADRLTVTYRGVAGVATAIQVSAANFGIFTTAAGKGPGIIQNYISATQLPLNTPSAPAMPGQTEILLGTGLGAISAPDNQSPPVGNLTVNVQVTVGGQPASVSYGGRMPGVAGVDQINFTVPANAPTGCYVPVQVQAGSTYSNTVTMAISPQGQACSDPFNPFGNTLANGGKLGSIFLLHADVLAALQAGQSPAALLLDIGLATFVNNPPASGQGFNLLLSLPPMGTCAAYSGSLDLSSLLGSPSSATGLAGPFGPALDAGPSISVSGAAGTQIMKPLDSTTQQSPYLGILGGMNPLDSSSSTPLLLSGTLQIKGTGGKDVGPFQASLNFPSAVTWTNRSQITQIDRSANLTLNWSGGDASKAVVIAGGSTDQTTQASAGFFCFALSTAGAFSVPSQILGSLPPTVGAQDALGFLMVMTVPNGSYQTFTASGLDSGFVSAINLAASTVAVK